MNDKFFNILSRLPFIDEDDLIDVKFGIQRSSKVQVDLSLTDMCAEWTLDKEPQLVRGEPFLLKLIKQGKGLESQC